MLFWVKKRASTVAGNICYLSDDIDELNFVSMKIEKCFLSVLQENNIVEIMIGTRDSRVTFGIPFKKSF